jgi:hypothetical protein
VYTRVNACMYTCLHVYTHVHVCTRVCTCMHVHARACTCVFTCTHVHIAQQGGRAHTRFDTHTNKPVDQLLKAMTPKGAEEGSDVGHCQRGGTNCTSCNEGGDTCARARARVHACTCTSCNKGRAHTHFDTHTNKPVDQLLKATTPKGAERSDVGR